MRGFLSRQPACIPGTDLQREKEREDEISATHLGKKWTVFSFIPLDWIVLVAPVAVCGSAELSVWMPTVKGGVQSEMVVF